MLSIDPMDLRMAVRARNRATAHYLSNPRVSLIDVGLKIKEQQGNRIINQLCVRVHLINKPTGPAFESFRSASPGQVIDEEVVGYPLDIIETRYRQHQSELRQSRARAHSPLRGGISVSNEWFFNFGTLGGIVKDQETGKQMILSNWHVLAGSSRAPAGLRIYQPGYGDGGDSRSTIARLKRHAMEQYIDAAVAELNDQRPTINDQLGIGSVSGVETPALGMRVIKSGRTSAVTRGIITGIGGVSTIQYGRFPHQIRHIVHIATADGDEVSAGGDSGSWWLEESTRRAIGLHFAGSNNPEYGLALEMAQVLQALKVDL
jgi:hypothetical protein